MEQGVAEWVADMRSLQKRCLTIVRDALRSDFPHAVAVLGISNLRIARRLAQLTVGDIDDLCERMAPRLIVRLDESLAVESLLESLMDDEIDPVIAKMGAYSTSESPAPVFGTVG